MQEFNTDQVLGTDVSRWQGNIDFDTMYFSESAGARFCIIKATEGTSVVDSNFTANWNAAGQIPLYRGFYHFYRPQSPVQQAQHFHNTAGNRIPELYPVLDFEVDSVNPNDVLTFLQTVENLFGLKPMIYTNANKWNALGSVSWAKNYPLWVAYWGPGDPFLPNGWTTWTFWQFASTGSGSQFGAESQFIDLNFFNGNLTQLASFANTQPATQPSPHINGIVVVDTLNVRSGPGTNYPIVRQIHAGDNLMIYNIGGTSSYWGRISQKDSLGDEWVAVVLSGNHFVEIIE